MISDLSSKSLQQVWVFYAALPPFQYQKEEKTIFSPTGLLLLNKRLFGLLGYFLFGTEEGEAAIKKQFLSLGVIYVILLKPVK